MEVLAELKDKRELPVKLVHYNKILKDEAMKLYQIGYPDSFDEYDLEAIENELKEDDREKGCLLAFRRGRIVGAVQYCQWIGPQALYMISYLYVKDTMQERGIGRMLCGAVEEIYKQDARIIFAINSGILPDYDTSYGFFKAIGYEEWGELPGYFRDDLSGIFFVKRNPYYAIGKGIPENSGWCPELADSRTGKRISQAKYRQVLHSLSQVPKAKWGL